MDIPGGECGFTFFTGGKHNMITYCMSQEMTNHMNMSILWQVAADLLISTYKQPSKWYCPLVLPLVLHIISPPIGRGMRNVY